MLSNCIYSTYVTVSIVGCIYKQTLELPIGAVKSNRLIMTKIDLESF